MITFSLIWTLFTATPLDPAAMAFAQSLSPLPPPPPSPTNALADRPEAASLGEVLFFDTGLSGTKAISCATCHVPDLAFTDGLPQSKGASAGQFNSPTLLGVAHQRWLFWDGRADSLWSQALSPFESPLEMDSSRVDVIRHVADTPHLRDAFIRLGGVLPDMTDLTRFPPGARPGEASWDAMDPVDQEAITSAFVIIGKCIAAYERQLQPAPAPFDLWVSSIQQENRDDALIGDAAVRGFALFTGDAGCTQCHFGPMISDFEFHDLGLPSAQQDAPHPGRGGGYTLLRANEFRRDGPWSDAPQSRVARRSASVRIGPEHWGAFRTPTLRNVGLTAPYMHDGRFASLAEVLHFYNTLEGQARRHHHAEDVLRPLDFDQTQLADLEAFLQSLSSPPHPTTMGGSHQAKSPSGRTQAEDSTE